MVFWWSKITFELTFIQSKIKAIIKSFQILFLWFLKVRKIVHIVFIWLSNFFDFAFFEVDIALFSQIEINAAVVLV